MIQRVLFLFFLVMITSSAYAQTSTNAQNFLDKARIAGKIQNYTQALHLISQALELEPTNSILLNEHGYFLLKAKQIDLAELSIQKAIINAKNVKVESVSWALLGNLYEVKKDKKQAAQAYQKSLRLNYDQKVEQQLQVLTGKTILGTVNGQSDVLPLTGQIATRKVDPPCRIHMIAYEIGDIQGQTPVGAVVIGGGKYALMKKNEIGNWDINWIDSARKDQIAPPPLTLEQALKMGVRQSKDQDSYDVTLNPGHKDQASERQSQGWTFKYTFDRNQRTSKVEVVHSKTHSSTYTYTFEYTCRHTKKKSTGTSKVKRVNKKKVAKKNKFGTLILSTNQAAKLMIDGKSKGTLPAKIKKTFRLKGGNHAIELRSLKKKKVKKLKINVKSSGKTSRYIKF